MNTFETAHAAADAGGEVLMRYFQSSELAVRAKAGPDLVSEADVTAEQTIVEIIQKTFPDHAILGEESHAGDVAAEHLWIVDPLDGTTNYLHGIPHFAVSVAYYHHGIAQCGVVWNPARGDLFTAIAGNGAQQNGQPIKVSPATSLGDSLIGVGFYYDRGAMMQATLDAVGDLFRGGIHGVRRMGTASLDLCQVATGCYGGFFEYELSPWDFAAGRLILEQAGGRITACDGETLQLKKTSVCASNGLLHDDMLNVVRPRFESITH